MVPMGEYPICSKSTEPLIAREKFMNTLVLKVGGMSCMGCVNSVKNLVSALSGIGNIEIDLPTGIVTVQHDATLATEAAIRAAISEGGYEVM